MRPPCRFASLLLLGAVAAWAVDWKALKPQGYVSDFAEVIDANSKAALEQYGRAVQDATGVQIAFVTVKSLEGEPIEDAANDIFHSFGIGEKGKDNGVLLLLSVGDRRSRLEVGGGLGGEIPDTLAGQVLEDMRPALHEGSYGEALIAAAKTIGATIAKAKGVAIKTALPAPGHSHPDQSIPWPMIVGGIVLLILLSRAGRGGYGGGGGFWPGLILGNVLSGGFGSRGQRSGGGFGGYDSGGGFGGFGGGDSSGGGASGSW